ncbi:MAG: ATPase, T2SS/T4P/T4SS family [Patescibacteria group bacterium]
MLQIPEQKFKELLLADGIVKAPDFDAAIKEAKRMNRTVASILLEQNFLTEDYYENLLSKFYGIPKANFSEQVIDETSLKLLPEDTARQKGVILFGKEADGSVKAAMLDPSDLVTIEFLESRLRMKVKPYLASREDFSRGLAFYGERVTQDFKKVIDESIQASVRAKVGEKQAKDAATDLPVVTLTENLLSYSIALRGSDIHLEVLEGEVLVRFRIDGILREIMRIPKDVHAALVARFKLLSGMKLDEHFKPQDGRFRYKIGGDIMDLRVSVMPTFYGEKVEMRLLSATDRPFSFEELGIDPEYAEMIKLNTKKTFGMILITGPTGSGKTTTLYSIMNALNRTEVNVVTIEDPIEYYMKYVNQTQVNPAAGITFANGLRALLRQDPNIIMVGEIRDEETAEISVHSALTGHLVLSSLHTNDAPTAIPRFIDLKVAPFLVSAVLNMVMAQRLVRRICMTCIVSYKVTPEIATALTRQIAELKLNLKTDFKIPKTMFRGQGCPSCGGSGYKSRMGIHEILNISEAIRRYIVNPEFTLDGLREIGHKEGYRTMFEDGLRKVERGMTTLEEVLRVIRE